MEEGYGSTDCYIITACVCYKKEPRCFFRLGLGAN